MTTINKQIARVSNGGGKREERILRLTQAAAAALGPMFVDRDVDDPDEQANDIVSLALRLDAHLRRLDRLPEVSE